MIGGMPVRGAWRLGFRAAFSDERNPACVRPMLAVSRGQLLCLSTPFGKRGWFYESWIGNGPWQRVCITADQCPRITREFLAEEEREIGPRWFRQEYQCSFEDIVDAVFRGEDIDAAIDQTLRPRCLE
jgi:hypothetical protein